MDEKTKKDRTKVSEDIKNAEKTAQIFTNWEQHMINRDEIESFTTIIKDNLYKIAPKKGEVLLPFSEFYGDHVENWIIILDIKTKKELARKNTRTVDMINWKLSSPQINTPKK